jgi:(E)-4-hydroxy-3-methylbut-2-enyl-diphosphate synthase
MELVAPSVALSLRLDDAVASGELETALEAAHRVHVRIDAGPPPAWVEDAIARTATTRAALLLEAASKEGNAGDAIERAVQAARAAQRHPGARLLLALDPRLGPSPLQTVRALAQRLEAERLDPPIVLLDRPAERGADPLLEPSSALGGLLCEGIGDSVLIEVPDASEARRLAFGILQGARVRMTRTEFISCPSCGRTLFDLETTTARVKARTAHLKGLKIAVMGCIVNGPGEMADADFGYVGWGDEKIALFVGKELVAKDIPTSEAEQRLVDLIREHGKWVDPPVPVAEEV